MINELPAFIDPIRFAKHNRRIEGYVNVNQMQRIGAMLLDDSVSFVVKIECYEREGIPILEGWIHVDLTLSCQRCLQAMPWLIEHHFMLGCLNEKTATVNLPSHIEPLMFDEDKLRLGNVIEDEVLLLLPLVPKHATSACFDGMVTQRTNLAQQETRVKENPFAVLKNFKKRL